MTTEVGGSALFAARFRECAARALLLPRRHPGKRSPLWHQRQRAAQLLDVARKYPDFPIVLETVRECLQDVYDVPTLTDLMSRIEQRRVRLVEVETPTPSPFAASLLFGYVGAFMYEGDSPLAERRAAALSLDTTLLAELLGRVELRELLDPEVIAATSRQLQHLADDRRARDAEAVADLLRLLGPLTEAEIAERSTATDVGGWLDGSARRQTRSAGVLCGPVVVGGHRGHRPAARRGRGGRSGRRAGEFHRDGDRSARRAARPVRADPRPVHHRRGGRAVRPGPAGGRRRTGPNGVGRQAGSRRVRRPRPDADQWCDAEVLRILRRRSLAALRAQVEPVSTAAYARFLPAWQQVGRSATSGVDGLAGVIEQLAGVPIPASAVEPLVFAPRVRDYQPAMLDELLASGEVTWSGAGSISGSDGWVAFHHADTAALTLAAPAEIEFTEAHRAIFDVLGSPGESRGAFFFRQLVQGRRRTRLQNRSVGTDLGRLGERRHVRPGAGHADRRTRPGTRRPAAAAHRQRRAPRLSRYSVAHAQARPVDPTVAGRWAALPAAEPDSTVRAHFSAELLLNRHGVLTKGAVGQRRMSPAASRRCTRCSAPSRRPGAASAATSSSRWAARNSPWPQRWIGCAATSTASTRNARTTTPSCSPPPTLRTRTVRRCPGLTAPMPTPATGRAARPARWWCWSTANWCGSPNAVDARC